MDDRTAISRGEHAKRLLDDEALTEAFESVRAGIMERWAMAPIRDREGQHELKLMLKLLGDVKGYLEQAVNDGKFAAESIRQRAQWRRAIGM